MNLKNTTDSADSFRRNPDRTGQINGPHADLAGQSFFPIPCQRALGVAGKSLLNAGPQKNELVGIGFASKKKQTTKSGSMENQQAKLFDYEKRYQNYLKKRWWWRAPQLYLIAAAPKSGSTWAATFLSEILNLPQIFAFDLPDQSEHKLCDLFLRRRGVIQQHCRYTSQTKIFIESLKIRTVVLVRDLPDTIISIKDHLRQENTGNWPWGFIDKEILGYKDEDMVDFLIRHIAPWYISFYAGWLSSKKNILTYDQIMSKPSQLLLSLGVQKTDVEIQAAVQRASRKFTRLNVGRPGRGRCELRPRQVEILRNLKASYNHLDLSPLGL